MTFLLLGFSNLWDLLSSSEFQFIYYGNMDIEPNDLLFIFFLSTNHPIIQESKNDV